MWWLNLAKSKLKLKCILRFYLSSNHQTCAISFYDFRVSIRHIWLWSGLSLHSQIDTTLQFIDSLSLLWCVAVILFKISPFFFTIFSCYFSIYHMISLFVWVQMFAIQSSIIRRFSSIIASRMHSVKHVTDPKELEEFRYFCSQNIPRFIRLYHLLKFHLENILPFTKFNLYQKTCEKTTYYYGFLEEASSIDK